MTAEMLITMIVGIFASTGFWQLVQFLIMRRDTKDSPERQMLKGLAHDRICHLGTSYLKQGYITMDDYQSLHDYLYVPYTRLGGNGTAKKIMDEVTALPIRKEPL